MGKLVVEGSIKIGGDSGIDINEWAEPAKDDDTRSYVVFDSNNEYLTITNPAYNKKYVKTSADHVAVNNHKLLLGEFGGEKIWLVQKGCFPSITARTNLIGPKDQPSNISSTGTKDYKFTLADNGHEVNITPKLGSSSGSTTIPTACFFIAINGAGSSGSRGHLEDKAFWAYDETIGKGGKSGAALVAYVDMTIVKSFDLHLGRGGKGTTDNDNRIAGEDSYILLASGTKIIIKGGYEEHVGECATQATKNGSAVEDVQSFNEGIIYLYQRPVIRDKLDYVSSVKNTVNCSFASGEISIDYKYGSKKGCNDSARGEPSIFANGADAAVGHNNVGGHGTAGAGGGGGRAAEAGSWGDDTNSVRGGDGGSAVFKLFY